MPFGKLQSGNRLLGALPREVLAGLRAVSSDTRLLSNQLLLEAGEAVENVYFPYEGLVSLLIVTPNGSIAEAGFVGADGVVGIRSSNDRKSYTRAIVVCSGMALCVPASEFELILGRSALLQNLVEQSRGRLTERAQQLAACNLLHGLEQRLRRWLLQVADHSTGSSVAITQDTLARMLGVKRTSLNEALKVLHASGAVDQTHRGTMAIINVNLIAERVCDCYRCMRSQNFNQ